jgi:hypothetical protein
MKIFVLICTTFLLAFQAAAQSNCLDNPALLSYKAARASELPTLDNLNDSQKDALEEAYDRAILATMDQFSTAIYKSKEINIPNISNRFNLEQVLAGDAIGGTLGIYADSTLAFSDSTILAVVSNELESARAAIRGSNPTFAEYHDIKYREGVSQRLLSAGCPANLEGEYALPPWTSP